MPTILVVDDSPVDRRLIAGVLQKSAGMIVATAQHGAEALEKMPATQPDVIVTDLSMPEMDGLQLVTAVRIHYPHVPVILVTAHGSESLAVQALEQGAASYVPKPQLAQKLLETVEHVLARSVSDETYERLTACMKQAEFHFALPSETALFERLVDLVQSIAVAMQLCDATQQVRLGMALEEALQAALYQGNLELTEEELLAARLDPVQAGTQLESRRTQPPYRDRRVHVHVALSPEVGRITIRHEGAVRAIAPVPDSAELGALDAPGARAAVLMHAMLDEVIYSEDGRGVTLIKRR